MHWLITFLLILGFVSPCLCMRSIVQTQNTFYNVMNYGARGDGKSDDSQALLRAWQDTCGTQGTQTLVIPHDRVFMVRNINLSGPCNATNIRIQFGGKIVAPGMGAWVGDKSGWIRILYVNGLTIDASGGIIDGYGSTWWENCRTCQRPVALSFHACNGLFVNSLNMTNSPGGHIAVSGCDGARFSQIKITAPESSPNTDGFDIANSKNILIEDSTIGTGDDCIAINGGSSYINATGVACGPGHGISIGSLGRNNSHEIVEEVYVRNCSFIGTSNGARIKTWPGGSGYARKITFEQIELRDTHNPIIIDQNYGTKSPNTTDDAVKVSDVTYRGFTGTSADGKAIGLNCSTLGCFNITLDQIYIVSSQPSQLAYAFCNNAHGTVGSTVPNVSCLSK